MHTTVNADCKGIDCHLLRTSKRTIANILQGGPAVVVSCQPDRYRSLIINDGELLDFAIPTPGVSESLSGVPNCHPSNVHPLLQLDCKYRPDYHAVWKAADGNDCSLLNSSGRYSAAKAQMKKRLVPGRL